MSEPSAPAPAAATQPTTNGEAPLSFEQLVDSDPVFKELVGNAVLFQRNFISALSDPRRDIDAECGYAATTELQPESYKEMYEREPIGTRVVEVLPKQAWQAQPEVFELESEDEFTPWEKRWDEISTKLRGNSRFKKLKGNPIWSYLRRVHILSRIGHYGVLLFGINDPKTDLTVPAFTIDKEGKSNTWKSEGEPPVANLAPTPVKVPPKKVKPVAGEVPDETDIPEEVEAAKGKRELLFLRAFDETTAKITRYDNNQASVRYGQPEIYELTLTNPTDVPIGGQGLPTSTISVHWTRILHVAETLSSEIFATPSQRPVWNRLFDLRKLYAGSAEMYWKGAFPGLSVETNPQLGANPKVDETKLRTQLWKYQQGLQRLLVLMGFQAKSLAPQVADPRVQVDVQLEAICIELGMPKRIFMGSERGELSSAQDSDEWDDTLDEYRHSYVIPGIIVPFVDRLIDLGVMPEPGLDGFDVEMAKKKQLSELELADMAVKIVEAMAKYIQGGCDVIMSPLDFLTRVLGFDGEEAEEILAATLEYLERQNPNAGADVIPGRDPMPEPGFDEGGNPLPDPELPLKIAQEKIKAKPPPLPKKAKAV